jgi:D-glycero-D-manno-heptose 1,7-bisphosphate phosphatase
MLLAAAEELGIDLSSSWMVGDKNADVEAGIAAGCRPILVRTGYGVVETALTPEGVPAVDDLLSAVELILNNSPLNIDNRRK